MQLLTRLHDDGEVARIVSLLHAKGIPTFVKSPWIRGRKGGHLFVVLDAQHEDALRLLSDPAHEVRDPVDVDDYERKFASFDNTPIQIGAMVVLGVVILAYVVLGWWMAREREKAEELERKTDAYWSTPSASAMDSL